MALLDDLEGTNNFQEVKDILNTWRDTLNAVLGGGTADQIPAKVSATDFNTAMVNSILPLGANLKVKVISIGDWNMDSSDSVSVAHGLSATEYKAIKKICVIVRDDNNDVYYPLDSINSAAGLMRGSATSIGATYITLTRTTSAGFDNTGFNATSFNRGFITVIYEA